MLVAEMTSTVNQARPTRHRPSGCRHRANAASVETSTRCLWKSKPFSPPSRGTPLAPMFSSQATSFRGWYKLYPTHQRNSWLRPARWKLATKTSTAISILFLGAILAVGMASMSSFHEQLMSVLIEEQDNLVERIADNLDQKLLALQRALALSAIEITEADIASPDAAQRYLDSNTGLYAAVDRSTFLFTAGGKELLAERPFRPNRRGVSAAHRAYIKDTIRTQQSVISEPFQSNVGDDDMVLVVTMPVFAKDGRMIAILTGSLGLTRPGMLGNIAKTVIGKTGYLFIVTADGKLIMHPA